MKNSLFFIIVTLFITNCSFGQSTIASSDKFTITWEVKKELVFTLNNLDTMRSENIGDLEITNFKGESKAFVKGMKGILLKQILSKIEYTADQPRDLNTFYFTFIATDGYKVVFSWNEIFNTAIGNSIYIVTEKDERNLHNMKERILVISTADLKTGSRYVKGLLKIAVNRSQ
jgi:hypothetical protein